jgi:sulfate/thiosulfate transport system substrate-binding protein
MNAIWNNVLSLCAVAVAVFLVFAKNVQTDEADDLLNVSSDATRELFTEINKQFIATYHAETGKLLNIKQYHGGSSLQARAVIDGLPADVVTLALASDVDALCKEGLIAEGWARRLPHDSEPFTSTIVFVVRAGNPKNIKDWPDLIAPGVTVVTPNPKTSGNGKLSVLAAWGSVVRRGGSEQEARDYLKRLFEHVPVLGAGARDSTMTFTQEKEGDVHLTWENEAQREIEEFKGELQIVYPPLSIRAEPSVAWVDKNVSRRKTQTFAVAYLNFLFTDQAQEILARFGCRPVNATILSRYRDRFPDIELFPVTAIAKDWNEAQLRFFAESGIFDTVCEAKNH